MTKNSIVEAARTFVADERGATAVEYAIMAAMIAGAIVVAVQNVGSALVNVFGNIANKLNM